MKFQISAFLVLGALLNAFFGASSARAVELDWNGDFRAEYNYIHNYNLDSTNSAGNDPARLDNKGRPQGYYIPTGGSNNATFEDLFFKLKPKVIVNDNISIKSEFWLGDPVYGFYGNAYPYTFDQRQFYSSQSRGSVITAQRFWADFLSDFGTIEVGRAPLQYGLGAVWNAGDGVFDHYESTGDVIRLISKFGAFTFSPSFVNYSTGNTLGGACVYDSATGLCQPGSGSGAISDYSLILKYENLEEDFEAGLNFIRRIAGGVQDLGVINSDGTSSSGMQGPISGTSGAAFNTWDLYGKKKFGRLTLGAEIPIVSGQLAGIPYSAVSAVVEADWRINDTWETQVKGGHVPGQPSSGSASYNSFSAYYLNPNYRIGTIMFNYALQNLGGYTAPNTANNPNVNGQLGSPYDNPLTNVNYLSWMGLLHADKWTFDLGAIYAHATQEAQGGNYYYNQWNRVLDARQASPNSQGGSYGLEIDAGAGFQWDEYFLAKLDLAAFFPGDFYKFTNVSGIENGTSTVLAAVIKVGVTF
ncbi:MAG: hypothetical protein P4M08_11565 [Oligoflexia bacterium]|nr:hypothetical protein [Oligoflexia bacterium]